MNYEGSVYSPLANSPLSFQLHRQKHQRPDLIQGFGLHPLHGPDFLAAGFLLPKQDFLLLLKLTQTARNHTE